jgi:SAM-dependent methyltransferase
MRTDEITYTRRLVEKRAVWWKRLLPVQAPYRWNLQRLKPGFTLDIGCGVGRTLEHLDGNGVGVDHNPHSVAAAQARGFTVFTSEAFSRTEYARADQFDSLLMAHLAEHLTTEQMQDLLATYLPTLKPGGRVIVITPQESGFRSDPTHERFVDFVTAAEDCVASGLRVMQQYSFPFPRSFGRIFTYNEFVTVAKKPDASPPDQVAHKTPPNP